MPTFREFQKFVTGKLNGEIPQNADDGGVSYEVANSFNNDGGDRIEKLVNLAIGPKSEAQLKVRNNLEYTSPGFMKAIQNFERYAAEQQKLQEKEAFEKVPEARDTKKVADDFVGFLNNKVKENQDSVLGSLFNSHKAKLDNKSKIIKEIVAEIEGLGYHDPETYKSRFKEVVNVYLQRDKAEKTPILGSDTREKLQGIISKLDPAPTPTVNKMKAGK